MSKHDIYDRSSKWLLDHRGGAILHLAGVEGFTAWRSRRAEIVQPRKLPDGFLEADFPDRDQPVPFLVEMATYPERRVVQQAVDDALIVYLDRGMLPEVVIVNLRPKGHYRIPAELE